jgi:zinc transporter
MITESLAYLIAPDGRAKQVPFAEASSHDIGDGLLWLHIDGNSDFCSAWLHGQSGLADAAIAALTAVETRPRATPFDKGVLVNLRGVNMNPEADPEDLVSIRLWAEAGRVLSVSYRPLLALDDLIAVVESGRVKDPGDLIVHLADVLTIRLETPINDLAERVDRLEEDVIEGERKSLRERIGRVRRTAIGLRRYISPQRDALSGLILGRFDWLHDDDRVHIGEALNRVTRMVEELDSVRERGAVLTEQLADMRAESMNERNLVLTVAGTVFLPLTFLTGLFGMNVGGIPFGQHNVGFSVISAASIAVGIALWVWLRRRDGLGG